MKNETKKQIQRAKRRSAALEKQAALRMEKLDEGAINGLIEQAKQQPIIYSDSFYPNNFSENPASDLAEDIIEQGHTEEVVINLADTFLSQLVYGLIAGPGLDGDFGVVEKLENKIPGLFNKYPWMIDLLNNPPWDRTYNKLLPLFGHSSYGNLVNELNEQKKGESWHRLEFIEEKEDMNESVFPRVYVGIGNLPSDAQKPGRGGKWYLSQFVDLINHQIGEENNRRWFKEHGFLGLLGINALDDIRQEGDSVYSIRVIR